MCALLLGLKRAVEDVGEAAGGALSEQAGRGADEKPAASDAEDHDEPTPWLVVSGVTVLVLVAGLLALPAGLITFFIGTWQTACGLLGAGVLCVVGAFVAIKAVAPRLEEPPGPRRRAKEAAEQHQLGEHLWTRRGGNPFFYLGLAPLAMAAPLAILVGLTWLLDGGDSVPEGRAAGGLLLIVLVLVLASPVLAVATLVLMPKSLVRAHLYSEGLVHELNGQIRVIRWADVTGVDLRRKRFDKEVYVLACRDGREFEVPTLRGLVDEPFARSLRVIAGRCGIPIHPDIGVPFGQALYRRP